MKHWAIILGAIVLSGCAHYRPYPLAPAVTAERFEQRSLDDAELKAYVSKNLGRDVDAWPPKRWNLELLTLAAYYFNPNLDVARAQWRVAKAGAITAGARPNPTLNVTPGFTANSPAGVSPWLFSGGLDWPIETAGKRSLRIQRAKHLAEVAHLNLVSAAWKVRAEVRDALAAYQFSGNQAAVAEQKLVLQRQVVELLEQRLTNGAVALVDVTPARVILGKAKVEMDTARAAQRAAAVRVVDAIGIPQHAFKDVPLEMTVYTPDISEAAVKKARSEALLRRADLLAALAEFDAAESDFKLEIAKQYPDLHLNPNYEFDQGANKWRLGLTLELPLLNHNEGPIAEAKARRDESAARFQALQAKVISEIDSAVEDFRRAREQLFGLQSTLNEEVKREQDTVAQVRAGAADHLDLASVRLERLGGATLNDETGYRSQQAYGKLEDALQQVIEPQAGVIAPVPPLDIDHSPRAER